ncbi:MAG: FAD-dependent oxidoreductase, partial [Deltaproteobacteria bacterium]|nr:FAD-dependent oxidoreductase [Deltaproteobacteria bacterium]
MDIVENTIIGAGLVGTAVAHELSKAGREVFVIEKNPGVTQGENQSSRNAGVIHSGLFYDQATRPLKAELCPLGVRMLYDFCQIHDVPHLCCGKLVVATSEKDRPNLEHYMAQARANGVEVRMLTRDEVAAREPNVQAVGALDLPSAGIVEPTRLVHTLYALSSNHGAHFLTHTELTAIRARTEGFELTVRNRDGNEDTFLSKTVINCAGLYADDVARMLDRDSPYEIDPLRGEFARFYHTKRPELMCNTNVYPAPVKVELPTGSYWAVGTHITPTIETAPDGSWAAGPVNIVGPLSGKARNKEAFDCDFSPMADYYREISDYFPGIEESDLEPQHAGVLAILSGHQDWFISRHRKHPEFFNLLGIDSPALTACLAIADYVRRLMEH